MTRRYAGAKKKKGGQMPRIFYNAVFWLSRQLDQYAVASATHRVTATLSAADVVPRDRPGLLALREARARPRARPPPCARRRARGVATRVATYRAAKG